MSTIMSENICIQKKKKIKKIELSGPKTLFGFKAIADKMYYFSKSAV